MPISLPTFSHYPAIPPPVAVRLPELEERECPYLPSREAKNRAVWVAGRVSPTVYHAFMDAGFRRSGRVLYQPVCACCRACIPIRLPVDAFQLSKSQRRIIRKNADLIVTVAEPRVTEENHFLYCTYLSQWHGRSSEEDLSRESFERFLYDSPVDTMEFSYRDRSGSLLAVGLCDVSDQSLSSVYFYFDPAERGRSLGVFGAVHEIQFAQARAIPHYYLGYWISGCKTMDYKAMYLPHELLGGDGIWRPT